jgi:hypothetical protein
MSTHELEPPTRHSTHEFEATALEYSRTIVTFMSTTSTTRLLPVSIELSNVNGKNFMLFNML